MNKKEPIKYFYTYLAGPIEKDTSDGGQTWRNKITPYLDDLNIYVQDPCKTEPDATGMDVIMAQEQFNKWIISGNKEIFHRKFKIIIKKDLRMVARSDFIIVHLFKDIETTGTIHEMVHAWERKIPIYVIWYNPQVKLSKWALQLIKESGGDIFPNIKQCVDFITAEYAPEELSLFRKAIQYVAYLYRTIEGSLYQMKINRMKRAAETQKERKAREEKAARKLEEEIKEVSQDGN